MVPATSRGRLGAAASVLAAAVLAATSLAGCAQTATPTSAGTASAGWTETISAGTTRAGTMAYPSSMDALGASMTRGYNTDCPTAWIDCPGNSWASGTNATVDSVYLRLLALNPALDGNNGNDAQSGSRMADLPGQAASAADRKVDLVLVAMGTNDACGGPSGAMTPIASFAADFTRAMDVLGAGLPRAEIRVVSIPDLYQLWELFHNDPAAVAAWRSGRMCDTLLTRPTSTAAEDVSRRTAVRQRVVDLNRVLARVCGKYPRCKTDGGAAFDLRLTVRSISTNDYWHANIAGQAQFASAIWATLGY